MLTRLIPKSSGNPKVTAVALAVLALSWISLGAASDAGAHAAARWHTAPVHRHYAATHRLAGVSPIVGRRAIRRLRRELRTADRRSVRGRAHRLERRHARALARDHRRHVGAPARRRHRHARALARNRRHARGLKGGVGGALAHAASRSRSLTHVVPGITSPAAAAYATGGAGALLVPGPGSTHSGAGATPGSAAGTGGAGATTGGAAGLGGTPLIGLGAPTTLSPARRTSRGARVTTPLSGGTSRIGARGRGRTAAPSLHHPLPPSQALPASSFPTVISKFIQFIPWWIWLAFGVAFVGAAAAGGAALRLGRVARAEAARAALVRADAMTDPLTGILNRRGFNSAAQRELERAQRYGHPLALAFVDVRGLKTVNDTRGHQAGDQLLKEVAALLRESSRSHDVVGRIGGDELAVLLAEQGAAGMNAVIRRVRAALPATRAALGFDHDWDLTIGMAIFPKDGRSLDELLDAADRRLYLQRGIQLR